MNDRAVLIDPAPRTFFGVPSVRDLEMLDAQVAFLGVPYDGGTPQPGIPTGQRAGPAAAREATRRSSIIRGLAMPGMIRARRAGMTSRPIATTWSG